MRGSYAPIITLVLGFLLGVVVMIPLVGDGLKKNIPQPQTDKKCKVGGFPCDWFIGLVNPVTVERNDWLCDSFDLPPLKIDSSETFPVGEFEIAVVGYAGPDPFIGYKERNPQNANLVTEIYQKGYLSKSISPNLPAGVVKANEPVCTRTFIARIRRYDKNGFPVYEKVSTPPIMIGFRTAERTVK